MLIDSDDLFKYIDKKLDYHKSKNENEYERGCIQTYRSIVAEAPYHQTKDTNAIILPEGQRLRINIKDGEVVGCDGDFFVRGGTWSATHKDLKHKIKKVNQIRISNPNLTQIFGDNFFIYIEWFKRFMYYDNMIVVEI